MNKRWEESVQWRKKKEERENERKEKERKVLGTIPEFRA